MKVVIVHGIADDEKDNPAGHWMPWIKEKLKEKEIECFIPLMPKAWNPNYNEWKNIFEKNKIDEDTILVGHSAGCAFILRWLAENKKNVKKIILVAPFILDWEGMEHLSNLVNFEFDNNLENYFDELIVFYADDDDEDILESVKFVKNKLSGEFVKLKGRGHFTFGDMGTKEFPELLERILS